MTGFCQIEYSVESSQLVEDYVVTTVRGPSGIYSSYLSEGNVSEFESTVFSEGELYVSNNNRDNLIDNIDLGVLPTDILFHLGYHGENVFVYGGSKIKVLDGDDHYVQLFDIFLTDTVSIVNSTFMPLIPRRYQLCSYNGTQVAGRDFLVCAPESGDLFIIEKISFSQFIIFKKFLPDHQSQVLSSSVKTDMDMNYLIWAVNYWDGTCKIKKIVWDTEDATFIIANEETWQNDEIIDFEIQVGINVAFLEKVIVFNPEDFTTLIQYNNKSVDKIENNFGHISGHKQLINLVSGDICSNDYFIDYAYSSCYDSDNGWIYFTGFFDDGIEKGFKIINYNPNATLPPNFHSYYLTGALDVKFHPCEVPGDFTVCAAGKGIFMGFNEYGDYQCEASLGAYFGYRIAIDAHLSAYSNGTLVACIKDGLVIQFLRTSCEPAIVNDVIDVGTSSSLTCYNEDEKILYIFYNGDGARGTVEMYDENTGLITNITPGLGSFTDCIYNKPSNFIAANLKYYGGDYVQLVKISNGIPILSEVNYTSANCLTNYNEYVYGFFEGENDSHILQRLSGENGQISESIYLNYPINSLEINTDDDFVYGTISSGKVMRVSHLDFQQGEEEYFDINGNDPVDICYISGLGKIYVAQNIIQKIEVYNLDFSFISDFNVTGYPKRIEYDPYQKIACILSESNNEDPGFNTITTVNCLNNQIINEKLIRRSDGYLFDTINDQFYFHSNYPGINENGALEFNVKSLDNFDNDFSNKVSLANSFFRVLLNFEGVNLRVENNNKKVNKWDVHESKERATKNFFIPSAR